MSFLDDLADEPAPLVPVIKGEVLPPRKSSEEKQADGLRKREDKLYERVLSVMNGIVLAPQAPQGEPPAEWVKEFGAETARTMAQVARDANSNPKEQPVYLGLAAKIHAGIMKAREARPQTVNNLNGQIFIIAAPPTAKAVMDSFGAGFALAPQEPQQSYPVIEIEPDEETEK